MPVGFSRLATTIAFVFGFCCGAQAAEITVDANPTATQFRKFILIRGELVSDDLDKFQEAASGDSHRTIVVLSSPGGSLKAGIEIGRIIHQKGLATGVFDICASACALAWLAGSTKYATSEARIGFHVAYSDGVERRESGMGNAIVGLYLGELGFKDNVVTYITSAAPDEMQWLSTRDASLLGIEVNVLPPLATTAPPEPPAELPSLSGNPDVADAAGLLVRQLVSSDMSRGADALTLVRNTYADRVRYYGKRTTFSAVYADKEKYFSRWPKRRYEIRENSFAVSCDTKYCTVSGVYDWDVSNPKSGKRAAGSATFQYVLEQVAGNLRVVAEQGEVLR